MGQEVGISMIRVTWEWLGQGPALDLADTVVIENGTERDLIASADEFERWARAEAPFLPEPLAGSLVISRPQLMDLRTTVREVVSVVAARNRPARTAITQLNRVSESSPEWIELDPKTLGLRTATMGRPVDRLLAWYARSALELIARERGRLRRCPAPSCGMFYLATRVSQRWCSTQCGSRARVARHYHQRKKETAAGGP